MNPRVRDRMRAAAAEAFPRNGAIDAAKIIERLVRGEMPTPELDDCSENSEVFDSSNEVTFSPTSASVQS